MSALPALTVRLDEARSPVRLSLDLDAPGRAALAERFGLEAVGAFSLRATARRVRGDSLRVEGHLEATVSYLCGVTLKPFDATLAEDFSQLFAARADDLVDGEIAIDPLADDTREPLDGGAVDVAELAYQLFALALDPYPRHPDAPPPPDEADESDEDEARASPFAVLSQLKPRGH